MRSGWPGLQPYPPSVGRPMPMHPNEICDKFFRYGQMIQEQQTMSTKPQGEPKFLRIEMPDGHTYDVPVSIIARSRAEHYAYHFDGDVQRSLDEDTLPLFRSDDYEITDWASNSLNWSDVSKHAVIVPGIPNTIDMEHDWCNVEKRIVHEFPASDLSARIDAYLVRKGIDPENCEPMD